jgi:hypothetical protein
MQPKYKFEVMLALCNKIEHCEWTDTFGRRAVSILNIQRNSLFETFQAFSLSLSLSLSFCLWYKRPHLRLAAAEWDVQQIMLLDIQRVDTHACITLLQEM